MSFFFQELANLVSTVVYPISKDIGKDFSDVVIPLLLFHWYSSPAGDVFVERTMPSANNNIFNLFANTVFKINS